MISPRSSSTCCGRPRRLASSPIAEIADPDEEIRRAVVRRLEEVPCESGRDMFAFFRCLGDCGAVYRAMERRQQVLFDFLCGNLQLSEVPFCDWPINDAAFLQRAAEEIGDVVVGESELTDDHIAFAAEHTSRFPGVEIKYRKRFIAFAHNSRTFVYRPVETTGLSPSVGRWWVRFRCWRVFSLFERSHFAGLFLPIARDPVSEASRKLSMGPSLCSSQ